MSIIPSPPPPEHYVSSTPTAVVARNYGAYTRTDEGFSYGTDTFETESEVTESGYLLSSMGGERSGFAALATIENSTYIEEVAFMHLYEIDDKDAVNNFIASRPYLRKALVSVRDQIEAIFGSTTVDLYVSDYDDYDEKVELVLNIMTTREAREIPSLLDAIDKEWTFVQDGRIRDEIIVLAYSVQQ